MSNQTFRNCGSDLVVSVLRSQVKALNEIILMIEDNNVNSEVIAANLRQVERDVRWLRASCFN